MAEFSYPDLERQLSEGSLNLLSRLVALHQAAQPGTQRQFSLHDVSSLAEDGWVLTWHGNGERGGSNVPFDLVDLEDLRGLGLVRNTGARPGMLHIPSQALAFERWRIERAGPEPVQHVEAVVQSMVSDAELLARHHAEAAKHLRSAFDLLWSNKTDDQTIVNLGGELRSALTAITADLVGHNTNPEAVATALEPWLFAQGRLPPRQAELLHPTVEYAMKCCQRAHHLHSERTKGHDDPLWPELRRTAFLTAVVIYELSSVEDGQQTA